MAEKLNVYIVIMFVLTNWFARADEDNDDVLLIILYF